MYILLYRESKYWFLRISGAGISLSIIFYRFILRISCLSKLATCSFLLLLLVHWVMRSTGTEKSTEVLQKSPFIACVGKRYLYRSDLESLDLSHIDPADADFFVKKYVEEWACKQRLIVQANYQLLQPFMEGKLNDYKNDLLAYHFLDTLVQAEFNNNVLSEEVPVYYRKHKERDFVLHHDIVKGIFLAIPKKVLCNIAVKSLMLSNKATERKKLQVYCKPYAHTTILETDQWFAWETVLAKIGYRPLGDVTRLLKTNKFVHVAGQTCIYFLKISQYKLAEEIAPLEVVRDRIKAI